MATPRPILAKLEVCSVGIVEKRSICRPHSFKRETKNQTESNGMNRRCEKSCIQGYSPQDAGLAAGKPFTPLFKLLIFHESTSH